MIPEIKKILYVTDLSKNAAYAFRYAVKSMQAFDADIIILSVVKSFNPVDEIPVAAQMGETKFKKARKQALENVRLRLEKRLKNYSTRELNGNQKKTIKDKISIHIKEGDPAAVILETAGNENVDMVIMGANSKDVLSYTFLGSVTKRVLRRIRKPVLTVPVPKGSVELSFKDDDSL